MMIHSFIVETFRENVLFTKDCLSQNLDFPWNNSESRAPLRLLRLKWGHFSSKIPKLFIYENSSLKPRHFHLLHSKDFCWKKLFPLIFNSCIHYHNSNILCRPLKKFHQNLLEKIDSSFEKLLLFLLDHALITKSWKSSYVVFPQRRRRTNNVVCD